MTMDPDADLESEYGEETTDFREETDRCTYCLYRGESTDLEDKIPNKCTLANGESCQACGRQSELLKQIGATKRLLDQLILEERKARVDVNRFHDPLHRLPPEVTSHIFRFTLPDFTLSGILFGSAPTESGVLTLGAVCQLWREIAWSIPDLWSNVMLRLDQQPTACGIDVVREWLERSGQLPLSIRLCLTEDFCWDQDQIIEEGSNIEPFILAFKDHSTRWKDLSVECHPVLLPYFTKNLNGVPLLRTLQLMLYSDEDPPSEVSPKFAIEGFEPQPDHVTAIGFDELQDIGISWNNVTDATVEGLDVAACLQLLLLTSAKLVKLCLRHICGNGERYSDPDVLIPQTPYILRHLQTLYLSSSSNFLTTILDSISLPSLEELSINGRWQGWAHFELDSTSTRKITDFLDRLSNPLSTFSLQYTHTCEQDLINFLYSLPSSVNNLKLDVRPRDERKIDNFLGLFDHLSRAPAATNGMPPRSELLPNLEIFECRLFKDGPIPWDRLPNLLRPMSGKPRPLKKLTIVERDGFHKRPPLIFTEREIGRSAVLDLIKLIEAGVDLFLPKKISSQNLLALLEK